MTLSCFQRKEGCLDTLANNYDVEALDACEECCMYPNLIFDISNMLGDSILRSRDTLINNLGQKITGLEIRLYISNITLYGENDSMQLNAFITSAIDGNVVRDDIRQVRSNISELTIGEFPTYGKFEKVRFKIGLDRKVLQDSFLNLSTDHLMNERNKIRQPNGSFAEMRVRYFLVDSNAEKFIGLDNLPLNAFHTKEQEINTRKGENIRFNITANYLPLINDIDLTQPDSIIQRAMLSKVSEIFK